jgi:hypothetical protein
MDEIQGLQFTARRLAVQLDLLIQALEESRPAQDIQELCREGRGSPGLCGHGPGRRRMT